MGTLWLRKWREKRWGRMTAEFHLPHPLLKYMLKHYTQLDQYVLGLQSRDLRLHLLILGQSADG